MITTKQFFDQLQEEEAYISCLMTVNTYSGLDLENQARIATSGDILTKNDSLDNDPLYKELSKEYYRAKKAKRNYELNNK